MIRLILLGFSAAVAAGLLFVNLYNSMVDAPNWGADLPNSMLVARHYFTVANPGDFFRVFSPINQILAVVTLIVCWKFKPERYIAIASLTLAILADALTFGYFYPRNEIMFMAPIEGSIDAIKAAWQQWSSMNWFRSAMCTVNVTLAFVLLINITKRSAS